MPGSSPLAARPPSADNTSTAREVATVAVDWRRVEHQLAALRVEGQHLAEEPDDALSGLARQRFKEYR
jgi:hypothetical protein